MELPAAGAVEAVTLYSPQLAVTGATDTEPAAFTRFAKTINVA
jgi:hypothetical protein